MWREVNLWETDFKWKCTVWEVTWNRRTMDADERTVAHGVKVDKNEDEYGNVWGEDVINGMRGLQVEHGSGRGKFNDTDWNDPTNWDNINLMLFFSLMV